MNNSAPLKTWQTPKVFILGANHTEAYKTGGTNEVYVNPTGTLYQHKVTSVFVKIPGASGYFTGYKS